MPNIGHDDYDNSCRIVLVGINVEILVEILVEINAEILVGINAKILIARAFIWVESNHCRN